MKNNISVLKLIVTIILTIAMVASISNMVFADNETDINALFDTGTNATNNTVNNTTNDTNEFENAVEKNVVSRNNTTNNTTNNSTNNTSNTLNTLNNTNRSTTNSLAKTGIGDTNSILTLIIVVSGIVAVYSYKKLNDYKKL